MRKAGKYLLAALVPAVALISCSKDSSLSDLRGTWNVTEANGFAIKNPDAVISFNPVAGVVYGMLGCNQLSATFEIEEEPGELELDQLNIDGFSCDHHEQELVIFSALRRVERFDVSGDGQSLLLSDGDKSVAVRLTRVSADPMEMAAATDALPSAAKTAPVYGKMAASDLAGTWELVRLGAGDELTGGQRPNITFDTIGTDSRECSVNGFLGCNSFFGTAKFEDPENPAKIDFENIGATRMMCEDMTLEHSFLQVLDKADLFGVLEDGTLCLVDDDRQTILAYFRSVAEK